MKHCDKMPAMHGKLYLTAYDGQGCEVWRMEQSNMIVVGAYPITAGALAGATGAQITRVAVGTNGTAPVEGDTAITNAVAVDIQSVEYPQDGAVRFNFTVGYNDAVGMAVREFGLLSRDGRLFARKVREPIEKTKYMSIVGAWEITI